MIDPPLNSIGLAQCENGMTFINEIDFHTVFVSPMYRTCMTTVGMFKTHPKKDKIKFLIVPIAKEGMHLCNDISGPFSRVFDFFSKPENCSGISFDFSLFHSYGTEATWQMDIISDLEMAQKAFSCLKSDRIDEKTFDVTQANDQFLEEVYN